jgi:plastocyanin
MTNRVMTSQEWAAAAALRSHRAQRRPGMRAQPWQTRVGNLFLALSMLGALVLAGCGQEASAVPKATSTATSPLVGGPSNHVVIIPQNDIFAPYVLVINQGDSVTWLNDDTMMHTVVSAPRAAGGTIDPTSFQLVLQPGQQSTITLRDAGVYYYYCGAHATLTSQGRAAANSNVRPYPLAMDGFIYVRGSRVSAPSSASVTMSANNQFTPWITVLSLGATVTWSNSTQQARELTTIPGYGDVNPQSFDVHVPAGGTASFTFRTPGIYDYYATGVATLDPIWQRAKAQPGVAGYPVAMEGVIAILDY